MVEQSELIFQAIRREMEMEVVVVVEIEVDSTGVVQEVDPEEEMTLLVKIKEALAISKDKKPDFEGTCILGCYLFIKQR